MRTEATIRMAASEASGIRLTIGAKTRIIKAKNIECNILESRVRPPLCTLTPERATAPDTGIPPTSEETILPKP